MMDKKNLKFQVSATTLQIVERCAAVAAGAVALLAASTAVTDANAKLNISTKTTNVVFANKMEPSTEGAILLNVVKRDPATGEMLAAHYSHASHASHSSHYSSSPVPYPYPYPNPNP